MEKETAMELKENWRLHGFDVGKAPIEASKPTLDDRFWMTAQVPGDVHSTLLMHRQIAHPYFGHNDQSSRWIEEKEWWYRTSFHYQLDSDREEHHELVFEGLDTFATIYVNGHEVGQTANMHVGHVFDVTRVLREGWNVIAVKFDPVRLHHEGKELFQWSSYTKERPWLRKAAMNFGWDWGPRMVTTGIWGSVRLRRSRIAKLDHVYARTVHLESSANVLEGAASARVRIDAEVIVHRRGGWSGGRSAEGLECVCRLLSPGGEAVAETISPVHAERGGGFHTEAELIVDSPKLWWTHDLGQPHLYQLEVVLRHGQEDLDRFTTPFGIRTIELQTKDAEGKEAFAFLLNGVKIYAKGANWIPADHFIGAIPGERYDDLVSLSVEANMNMLRVWGGGIYEKDVFYDACDRQGVLVWQDFAFANALFPDFNRNFMENVRSEVESNVKRLRNRASLALWCGNNEIDWLVDMKTAGGDIHCPFYGETIYHELIPDVLQQYDDSRPYWPSSPFGGNDANDPGVGDRHNWQVWHGSVYPRKFGEPPQLDYSIKGVSFKNYKKDFALFSSEFGMHASANRYTLEKFIPQGEFYWNSSEMAYRNKDTNHLKGILLMEGYTGIPQNIEEYMNYSMLTQAEGLKYGIEHYRRIKHRNGGALVWQLNDSWPGTSWSMIDYELLPKASYYYAKTFFHPVLLSLDHEPGEDLRVWVVNDTMKELAGTIELRVVDFAGKEVFSRSLHVQAAANTAVEIGQLAEAEALQNADPGRVLVQLQARGFAAPENRYYLRDPKELAMPAAQLEVQADNPGKVTITATKHLARMVKLDLPRSNTRFSDNFFDLLPGESRTVLITDREGQPVTLDGLRVSALNVQ